MGIIITTPYRSSTSRTDFTPAGNGQLAQETSSNSLSSGSYGQVELTYDPSALHSFPLSANNNLNQSNLPQ
jgi:ferric enterobactin receptor